MKSNGYDSRQWNVPRARHWRLYTHQWGEQVGVSPPDVRQTRTVETNNSNGSNSPLTVQSNPCRGNVGQHAHRVLRRCNASCAPRQCQAVDAPTGGVIQSRTQRDDT